MAIDIAAMYGTSRYCMDFPPDRIMVDRADGEAMTMSVDTFNRLYYRLSEDCAALKEDCIMYTRYKDDKDLGDYPDWFVQHIYNGTITTIKGISIFYNTDGEPSIMSPEAIILRNFMGEVMFMLPETFVKYYELIGGHWDEG